MKLNIVIALIICSIISSCKTHVSQLSHDENGTDDTYMTLSINMLESLRAGHDVSFIEQAFAETTLEEIAKEIDTDSEIYAFWINVYNAYILSILNKEPELYEDRRAFFKEPYINIAGNLMSFADIEHGIIRRSQKEYFLGYVSHFFPSKYQKELRPDKRDYRVHFALNCGAKSCPPIAILKPEIVDSQFEELANIYLQKVSIYDQESNIVTTSPLMSWFRGDFGGKKGTKKLLAQRGIIPNEKVNLKFGPYDWTLDLNNFIDL